MNEQDKGSCIPNEADSYNIPVDSEGKNVLTGSKTENFTCVSVEVFAVKPMM